ncbi:MAG TPA: chlorite dismutase family protein [Candidatus Limnocylindrales bacterium]|nr:chlorite dismutase family protein [Candidatus Limnocylindrales bacterium]
MTDHSAAPAAPAAPAARPYVQALALGLDPAWRRLPDAERRADADAYACSVEAGRPGLRTFVYSMVGLEPGVDLLVWRLGDTLDVLEEAAAADLRTGLGRWLTVRRSFLGLVNASQYVAKASSQEQSAFDGERGRYLVVYPFTKSTDWYLLGREARQGIMNEHMRIGRGYPQVRQLLAYSFGLDDQDFVVAYEMDDLPAFGDLVRELRGSDSRRSTVNDTPILTGIQRPIREILALLGAGPDGGEAAP